MHAGKLPGSLRSVGSETAEIEIRSSARSSSNGRMSIASIGKPANTGNRRSATERLSVCSERQISSRSNKL